MTDYADLVYNSGMRSLSAPQKKAAGLDYADAVYSTPALGVSDSNAAGTVGEREVVLPGRSAGFMAGLKGNIATDPAARIPQYAKALFPNDPEASKRFGVVDGKIVYRGKDGSLYDAEGGITTKLGAAVASAPELIGGIAGSFSASPVVGGTLGATAGKAAKSAVANLALGERQTPEGVATDLGVEAAANLAGGGLAKGTGAALNRSAMSGAERVDRAGVKQKIADTQAKTGITLDFSQAADVAELRMWKRFAAEYPNEAADIVSKLDQKQVGQIEAAFSDRLLPALSKQADSDFNATRAVDVAKGIIEAAKAKRAEAVKPLYDAAFAEFERKGFVKGQVIAEFKKNPILAAAIAGVQKDPVYRSELMKYPGNNLALLDLAKRKLDGMIGAERGQMKPDMNRVRLMENARTDMVRRLDALPGMESYAKARGTFEQITRESVEPLTKGLVGTLAKIEGPHKSKMVADFMQGLPKNPGMVIQMRKEFASQDPEAWGGMVRLSIEKTLDRALKDNTTGEVTAAQVAGRLRQQLYGSPQQRAVFDAALGKDAGAAAELFSTLELIAKDFRPNSATVPKALVAEEAGRPGVFQSGAAKVATGINPLDWGRALRDWGTMVRTGEAAKGIANALSDPEKILALRQLRRVTNEQQRAIQLVALLGAQTSLAAAASPDDAAPQQ